jgi:MFS family permease
MRKSLAPLGFGPFRKLFAAQAISMVGSTLTPVALSLGILQQTHSAADLGVVLAAGSFPTVVMLLVGGVFADRFARQRVMVVTNLACMVAQAGLGVMLITGAFNLWSAVALQVLLGLARAFYFPASTGLTAQTVPAANLQQANALLSLVRSISGSAGPVVAGVLVVTVGAGWALVADAVSYLLSAVLLGTLVLSAQPKRSDDEPFHRQLRQGFREVIGRNWVWSSIVVFMFSHLATAVLLVLGPALALGREHGVAAWSGIIACLSLGQLLGDLLALRWTPRRPLVASRLIELLAVPLLVAMAFGAPLPVLLLTAAMSGVSMSFPDSLWFTAMQQHLPAEVLSRVSSYDWMGSLALRPLGLVCAAALAQTFGVAGTLVGVAVALLVTRLGGLLFRDVRSLQPVTETKEPQPQAAATSDAAST